jgi:hypothetical protein
MDTLPPQKKGIGTLGWLGIGCGSIIALCIIGGILFTFFFGGKIKEFAEEAQKNPTRTTATTMVKASFGQLEMVAEDDANKRYTVKEKQGGKLTTIYWDAKKNAPEVISGDFSAIPVEAAAPEVTTPTPAEN